MPLCDVTSLENQGLVRSLLSSEGKALKLPCSGWQGKANLAWRTLESRFWHSTETPSYHFIVKIFHSNHIEKKQPDFRGHGVFLRIFLRMLSAGSERSFVGPSWLKNIQQVSLQENLFRAFIRLLVTLRWHIVWSFPIGLILESFFNPKPSWHTH